MPVKDLSPIHFLLNNNFIMRAFPVLQRDIGQTIHVCTILGRRLA